MPRSARCKYTGGQCLQGEFVSLLEVPSAGTTFSAAALSHERLGGLWARLVLLLCLCVVAPLTWAAPAVLSIVSELSPVQAGQSFYLQVTYDSAMDTTVNPVFSFPTAGEDPGSFLMLKSGAWVSATTFQQIYEADFVTVNTSRVDVAVDGAKDTLGDAQLPGFQADVFDITPFVVFIPAPHVMDMKGDIDGGVPVQPAGSGHVLTDADVGKTVTFVIRYDIASDYGGCPNGVPLNYLCPNIVFTNAGGMPLSLTNLAMTWTNRNRIIMTWTVADGDEQYDSINVMIAGGVGRKDDPSNKNTDFELAGVFSIDTKNPSALAVAPSTAVLRSDLPALRGAVGGNSKNGNSNSLRAGELFTLTVTFSEPMDTTSTPVLSFPNQPGLAALLTPAGGSWTDSTHYVQNYTAGAGNLVLPAVDVQVTGARDANGNLQNVGLLAGVFAVALGAAGLLAVPTLSPWGIVLLCAVLAALGGAAPLRGRRRAG